MSIFFYENKYMSIMLKDSNIVNLFIYFRVDKNEDGRITEEEVKEVRKQIKYCFSIKDD